MNKPLLAIAAVCGFLTAPLAAAPVQVSGIYPSLATFNEEGECGTGAVVPWADRLWVITYGPHLPHGSSDKLYEITPDLKQIVRPESVGGTPANRMIHRETNQLLIGPYVIDAKGNVRVLSPKIMPGRLTGNARHLTDPANKAYYATMEEGLYEVDLNTLAVTGLIKDGNGGITSKERPATLDSKLPGYHGKGLFSGQGRVVYANNGDRDPRVVTDPTVPSGALGEWFKPGEDWQLVRRNQFTEVTGPGGIYGNEKPETDPIWSIGWDAKSLILMVLDSGKWHAYRLPKGSHSYDGAHGWNTEWPRIRDIGENDFLMTMHGTFWRFPKTFSAKNSAGIAPRSNYLKVIGDFCRWNDKLVFGCDDTAKSEFLNKRKAKGKVTGPGQSQSNFWFVDAPRLDNLGPVLGRGAVWLNDEVKANTPSDAFLFSGYDLRGLHLSHNNVQPVKFTFEVDERGDGTWKTLRSETVPAKGAAWVEFPATQRGVWIRISTDRDVAKATAYFQYRNAEKRTATADAAFAGLATVADKTTSGGLLYARGANLRTLRFGSQSSDGTSGLYELNADLKLQATTDPAGLDWLSKNVPIPTDVLTVDAASVLYVDDAGRRWRLPKGDAAFDQPGALGAERLCREVATERDLFNAHGTFYELPAENAGGLAKIRPVASHKLRIKDYASFRGMLVLSGVVANAPANPHIVRSEDGKAALWLGAVDDLWQLGKPRGHGGPWNASPVKANVSSDPYLMTGYDQKSLTLSHTGATPVKFRLDIDATGTGQWTLHKEFTLAPGKAETYTFPASFSAYWTRLVADQDTTATATFLYQ